MARLLQTPGCMPRNVTSKIVLASQLFAASVGFVTAALPLASAQTATDQSNSKSDRELTQRIRKAVVSDKSLSFSAHNITIASRDGAVTLKGTVKSEEEKKAVEDKAIQIAGPGKVTSELTVASK